MNVSAYYEHNLLYGLPGLELRVRQEFLHPMQLPTCTMIINLSKPPVQTPHSSMPRIPVTPLRCAVAEHIRKTNYLILIGAQKMDGHAH